MRQKHECPAFTLYTLLYIALYPEDEYTYMVSIFTLVSSWEEIISEFK